MPEKDIRTATKIEIQTHAHTHTHILNFCSSYGIINFSRFFLHRML